MNSIFTMKFWITSVIILIANLTMATPNDCDRNSVQIDSFIPSYIAGFGNGFVFELKMHLALGTHGRGIGVNAITTYTGSAGSLRGGIGYSYYQSEIGTGKTDVETRIFGGGTLKINRSWRVGYYNTKFISGETSQHTGNIITSYKDLSFTFENDMLGDLGDRYRTHASVLSYKDMSIGLNLFTSDPGKNKGMRRIIEDEGAYGTYLLSSEGDDPDKYRLGILYLRYKTFRLGTNSEHIRHWTQNLLIHDSMHSPQFGITDKKWRLYGGIYTYNPFTAW